MSTTHLTRHQASALMSVRSALQSLSGRRVGVRITSVDADDIKLFYIDNIEMLATL